MAGGWRYLWTDAGVGEWGLAARACWWACVQCLWCPCVPCRCCARWMVIRRGGGSVLCGVLWVRFSQLVEQEFEEVGLVLSYASFGLVLFFLNVSLVYILVLFTLIQPQSIGLWGHLCRFCCCEASFSAFGHTHAFVDPVTHPSVFLGEKCKCGYPQSARISGQLPPIRSDLDHFRSSLYSAPPKILPEQFLHIMDTPDSFLVSVAAEMVAFR